MKIVLPVFELLNATDYRSFLREIYSTNKAKEKSFSFAFIAKQCGFASKSFFKDVLDGKKGLSLESANRLSKGLGFNTTWTKYFLLLADQDEHYSTQSKSEIQLELNRLKSKLARQKNTIQLDKKSEVFQLLYWPYIYAALGSRETGASLRQIADKTKLSDETILLTLEKLEREGMATFKKGRYYAGESTAFFTSLGKSDFFKNFYLETLSRQSEKARKDFNNENSLFYSMALSVDHKKIPALRSELADLLDRYTENAEDADGTSVMSLNCGLHLI